MAFSLKKWIGSMLFSAFMNEYNENMGDIESEFDSVDEAVGAIESILGGVGAGFHNSIYRGKSLGTSVSPEQYLAIANGSFDDMFVGDYWTVDGVLYRIAAFDYHLGKGDVATTDHHVTLIPDLIMGSAQMNSTNDTTGAYMGSEMYATNLNSYRTTIRSAFSGHVLKHRLRLASATTGGAASAVTWVDSEVELMNEHMVYGATVVGASSAYEHFYHVQTCNSQLPLFRFRPDLICVNSTAWWLRDVSTATRFADVDSLGYAYSGSASSLRGVRPAFSIS